MFLGQLVRILVRVSRYGAFAPNVLRLTLVFHAGPLAQRARGQKDW